MNKEEICPVVCAVGEDYIICVPAKREVLMSVDIGGETFYCHSNGVRVSDTKVQKFTVPSERLDKSKKYTVTYEVINERLPYSCDKQPPVSVEFSFRPIEKENGLNIYHLSDVHGFKEQAVKAGGFFGNALDILVLNGDIASSSGTSEEVMLTYEIAYEITKGELPCVISRGNHDLRGRYAEKLETLMPTDNGRSYFTIRLGSLWILVLDCGEDKEDTHKEYSGTVAFHQFRKSESRFIEKIIRNKSTEYEADGVKHRMVLCHVPFCYDNQEECKGECPFDIEKELYTDWCKKIRDNIKPDLSLFGHLHVTEVCSEKSRFDNKGLGGNIVIGGKPVSKSGLGKDIIGTALNVEKDGIRVRFTDKKGKELEDKTVKKNF